MSKQLSLWEKRFQTLTDAFEKFHADNPHVWELFKKFATEAKASGRSHYSARTILHRLRWHVSIETKGDEEFKINDHHSPFYARKLAAEDVKFKGFFRNRASQADNS